MDDVVGGFPCDAGTSQGHFAGLLLTAVLLLTDTVGRKGVRRDDVRTGLYILFVNALDNVWSRQTEHVIVTHQRHGPPGKLPLMVALRRQSLRLYLGAHGPVQNQNTFP